MLAISLGAGQIGAFLVTQFILSFSAAGIPGAGSVRSLPAYLATGVPIEGVLMGEFWSGYRESNARGE